MKQSNVPMVTFQPGGKSIAAPSHRSILELSAKAKVLIPTRCKGVAGCLMCKIEINDSSAVNAPTRAEELKLGPLLEQGIRLACQTKVCKEVTVQIPEDKLKSIVRKQLERLKQGVEEDDWLA